MTRTSLVSLRQYAVNAADARDEFIRAEEEWQKTRSDEAVARMKAASAAIDELDREIAVRVIHTLTGRLPRADRKARDAKEGA
ncbi:MAG: hypothetical protein JWO05_1123 [Gemmatimonadetes bacterium]|nr:hypothetical protein [Gemmatimonadota bacterium]